MLKSLTLTLVLVAILLPTDLLAAGPGEPCNPATSVDECADRNYICKKKTPKSSLFTCECVWGSLEVGLLNVDPGMDICKFVSDTGAGTVGLIRQLVVAVTVLTVMAAMVSIVIGGYIYMTAGGSADRVRVAKFWIGSALLGMALALLAWLILNAISPSLV